MAEGGDVSSENQMYHFNGGDQGYNYQSNMVAFQDPSGTGLFCISNEAQSEMKSGKQSWTLTSTPSGPLLLATPATDSSNPIIALIAYLNPGVQCESGYLPWPEPGEGDYSEKDPPFIQPYIDRNLPPCNAYHGVTPAMVSVPVVSVPVYIIGTSNLPGQEQGTYYAENCEMAATENNEPEEDNVIISDNQQNGKKSPEPVVKNLGETGRAAQMDMGKSRKARKSGDSKKRAEPILVTKQDLATPPAQNWSVQGKRGEPRSAMAGTSEKHPESNGVPQNKRGEPRSIIRGESEKPLEPNGWGRQSKLGKPLHTGKGDNEEVLPLLRNGWTMSVGNTDANNNNVVAGAAKEWPALDAPQPKPKLAPRRQVTRSVQTRSSSASTSGQREPENIWSRVRQTPVVRVRPLDEDDWPSMLDSGPEGKDGSKKGQPVPRSSGLNNGRGNECGGTWAPTTPTSNSSNDGKNGRTSYRDMISSPKKK